MSHGGAGVKQKVLSDGALNYTTALCCRKIEREHLMLMGRQLAEEKQQLLKNKEEFKAMVVNVNYRGYMGVKILRNNSY